jgi:hypothetical protein
MCDLCSNDPERKRNAREGTAMMADRFERMARLLRGLANGTTFPHHEKNGGAVLARFLIRYLVEEWM